MKKLAISMTLLAIGIILLIIGGTYIYLSSPVGGNRTVQFEVKEGDTLSTISVRLKESKLIKSPLFYKMYIKFKNSKALTVGVYELHTNMNVSKIVTTLTGNPSVKSTRITFKEGRNMRYIVSQITQHTTITENEIYALLKDKNYLTTLKKQYWFITDTVMDDQLYYSLEGYLYPDTYEFRGNSTIKEIFAKMLDNMNVKITPYKALLQNGNYSLHQYLTLASMVELEATTLSDRSGVAGVFYNRLRNKMPLGSDVTTYYAAKVDMGERDLYKTELNAYNAYNTRNTGMVGKLPIGPVCNPSIMSIKAVLEPTISNNYYFVADKNKKVYFTTNNTEHNKIVSQLKKAGLWYEY